MFVSFYIVKGSKNCQNRKGKVKIMKKALLSAVSVLLAAATLTADISAAGKDKFTDKQIKDWYLNAEEEDYTKSTSLSASQVKLFQDGKAIVSFLNSGFDSVNGTLALHVRIEFTTTDGKTSDYSVNISDRAVYTGDELLMGAVVRNKSDLSGITIYSYLAYVTAPSGWDTSRVLAERNPDISVAVLDSGKNGWQKAEGKEFYVKKNGQLATSNTTISGTRYKFDKNGVYKGKYTGWTKSSKGRRYYKDGKLIKSKWIKNKYGERYYVDKNGYSVTGRAVINGELCYFDKNGLWDGLKHARTGEIIVTDKKTGKVYVSKNNGKTWVDGKKPAVYAYADKTKVSINGKSVKFIYVNNSKKAVEHADSGDLWRNGKALSHAVDDVLCTLKAGKRGEDVQYFADYNYNFETGKKATVIKKGDYEYRITLGDYEIVTGFEIA